jgi:hypothetical protein
MKHERGPQGPSLSFVGVARLVSQSVGYHCQYPQPAPEASMSRRALLLCVPVIAVLALAARLQAQSDTFRAGMQSITIPTPAADLVEPGPDYRVLLEPMAPVTNRLIAGFLQPADLEAMRSKGGNQLLHYALVEVPRRAEFADVTPDLFKQVADSVAGQFGASLDGTLKDQQDEVNRRLKELGSAKSVTIDKAVPLGAFFKKPDATSYGMIMPVTVDSKTVKLAMDMIVVRVRQRLLFLYIYNEYKDESSIQWLRTTGEQWADAILKANRP